MKKIFSPKQFQDYTKADSEFSKIQKDKLLLKYQHQLGIILAKLEKLDQASKHPDLGPVGDGLITLMDQKLSKLDDRLYEIIIKDDKHSKIEKQEIKEPDNKKARTKTDRSQNHFKDTFSFEKSKKNKNGTNRNSSNKIKAII